VATVWPLYHKGLIGGVMKRADEELPEASAHVYILYFTHREQATRVNGARLIIECM
jgi:hypothetical protein